VDYGSVRIGLAVSDPERRMAFPLEVRERRGAEADAAFFRALVEREEVGAVVVGLPVHLDGREGAKAVEARKFGAWLAAQTGVPLTFCDERFTTVQAESALWQAGLTHKRRKERRDKVAAQMLLQAYLDAGCPAEAPLRALDDPGEDKSPAP
jgi:putative Holliday junction resolvase